MLRKRGHDLTIVGNGREAVDAVARETFDVVLMDVQMPEMGGLEATQAIREHELQTGAHVRIIAMTAHAMNGDRERCLASGMDGYLSKPVGREIMYAAVESGAPAAVCPTNVQPLDRMGLLARLGGDEHRLRDVVEVFLEDCPKRIAAIKAAVDVRDAELIRTTAIALKGVAANLAATGLFEAARTLERVGAEGRLDAAPAAWRRLSVEGANVLNELRLFETAAAHA
jgi:CheY-like chemotaxis protein/HPt (histidine-containing phosphotransfer) domain-containing protein